MFRVESIVVGTILATCLTQLAAAGEIAFQPAQSYPVGSNPIWVVTADFNNDGKSDLAVINRGDATVGDPGGVSILFGNGDGTFQPAKNIAIGKNCTSAVVGDFDGDGNEDLALLRPGDATVSDNGDVTVFLGNGDGTFRQGQVLTSGKNPSSEYFSIVAADLNGDQRLDLLVANSGDKTFSVLLGNGNGTFQSPVAYPVGVQPRSIFVADLTGSGEKDVVVFGLFVVQPWLANGDGTFHQGSGFSNNGVLAGDLNGDKKADLVVTPFVLCLFHPCSPVYPFVRLGNGDGTFQSSQNNLGQYVTAAGDFDGDGKLDLAGTATGPEIQILPGNGDGTFQAPLVVSSNATLSQVLDANGDSAPDLVLIGTNSISLLVNVGTDFSISASALSSSTLSAGQSATSSLTLKLLSDFNDPVSLTCAVQPAQSGAPTCSVSASSVTFDNTGDATATLKISAGSMAASRSSSQLLGGHGWLWLPVVGLALLGSGMGTTRTTRRRALVALLAACLFIGLGVELGCGGGGSSAPQSMNYSVTVTGKAAVTQKSVTVNVTVQ